MPYFSWGRGEVKENEKNVVQSFGDNEGIPKHTHTHTHTLGCCCFD
jgi:hypothetical protein